MQPTTQKMLPGMTIAGPRSAAHPGLRIRVTYGFLILAFCLMIADCYRLVRAPAPAAESPAISHTTRI